MKHLFLLTLLFCLIGFNSSAQTKLIRRWSKGKTEMTDKSLRYTQRANIFKDYKWTYPDVKSHPLDFSKGSCEFEFAGQVITASLEGANKMKITAPAGVGATAEEQLSKGDMYYDKSALRMKAISIPTWTSYTTFVSQPTSVMRTRPVTSYTYQNGHSVAQTRYESYMTTEYRMMPQTSWRYVNNTTWVPDIPKYPYYSFPLNDSLNLVIYKAADNKYFCQNSSYLIATDENKINHIFIDANANGEFLDDADKVIFNSWNPHSKTSAFKSAGSFHDNKWYDIKSLREYHFLTFQQDKASHSLAIAYENSQFAGTKDVGQVHFKKMLPRTKLFINGDEYKVKNDGTATYRCQFGKFSVRIARDGYMDFETIYTLDSSHHYKIIAYEPTVKAGKLTIEDIYLNKYFVSVEGENGYSRSYTNTSTLNLPTGKNTVSIYSEGFTLTKELDITAGQALTLNFEKEATEKTKAAVPVPEVAPDSVAPASPVPKE
jgi:hypothetical protein